MGKEANIRHKSTKLPVQLYRAFFKLSIAAAVYAAFCVFKGLGIGGTGFAVSISLLGAIAYEVTYLVYKSRSKESKAKNENMTWKQVFMLLRFSGYLLGLYLVVLSADIIHKGIYLAIPLLVIAFGLCQQMHNNVYLSSHLSTFFESVAAGFTVITLELIYSALYIYQHKYLWIIGVCATVVLYALSEFFFHFYNCKKHGKKVVDKKWDELEKAEKKAEKQKKKENAVPLASDTDKKSAEKAKKLAKRKLKAQRKREVRIACRIFLPKKELILDRLAEFLRNSLLVVAIWVIFALLIISGSVEFAIKSGIYDKAIAIIPILISIATPVIDSQKQKESAESKYDKYDPRIPPKELKEVFINVFGQDSLSEKALDDVVDSMNKKNGFKRYNGEDYFVHPIAVAKIILDHTKEGDEVIAAALLHDCIEDLPGCTYETIKDDYNETVAKYVDLLSKKPGVDYRDPSNMWKYLDAIAEEPKAAIIKIADRINNMNTLDNCTDDEKQRKFEQTRRYYPQFVAKVKIKDTGNAHFYEFAEKCFEDRQYK